MPGRGIQTRIIIGILLIVFGSLFLLNNYNLINFPFNSITWEYFFIGFGLILLIASKNKTAGTIFIAIGLFNFLPELWPLIFVLMGLLIIFRTRKYIPRRTHSASYFDSNNQQSNDKDIIEETNIFGSNSKVVHSDNFKGGNVLSLFGGSEVNLSNCKLAEGENILEVTFVFGGSTLIVPSDWKVETDVLAIFGGFGDKRRKDPNVVYDQSKTLIVKGFVLFGGGEIKN